MSHSALFLAAKNPEPQPPQRSSLLTLEEIAEELRISQKGVRRLEARGKIQLRRIGRKVVCSRSEVERLQRDGAPLDEE